jgi:hypothetical protein
VSTVSGTHTLGLLNEPLTVQLALWTGVVLNLGLALLWSRP